MLSVGGVVCGNFGPESFGVVEVIKVGELVNNDIVTEWLRGVHETDIK